MPGLKLPRLPDRNPVKLGISVMPELHQALTDYAALYATTYGREEPVADLIPAMLSAFLESDRAFKRPRCRQMNADEKPERLVKRDEVERRIGLGRSMIHRSIQEGDFRRRTKLRLARPDGAIARSSTGLTT